jgi:acyl-CoA synthetase (AMP-forming)/AMP-acid ligase II
VLLPEILADRAAREPDKPAYLFLDENGAEKAELTYGELHARALAVAARLAAHCAPGDRALLLFPQCLEFVVAYFGCLYAHVVAVPVNPPRRSRIQDATRAIVADCEPAAVLTVGAMNTLRSTMGSLAGGPVWIDVGEVPDADFDPAPVSPDTLAFLQYTSGSTATPKGVMVSHRNLVANQEMIRRGFCHDEGSTVVGWAPLFHDQGLIGNVLQPMYVGAVAILMAPATFVRRPMLWLSAISRYRAHTSGGPNFAFDACVAWASRNGVPDLDLSGWKVAFNGAEPIRPGTLHRFARTFGPAGFRAEALYPCYGLAEATLIVTGSRNGRGPRTLTADADELGRDRLVAASQGRALAGSGTVLPDGEVRIVDPDSRDARVSGEIGEIWVAGDHVAQGYWKRPETTANVFRAVCAGEPARTYLRTGDMGALVDGELYVTGRRKDMIVVRGRNHYPQDIEQTVEAAHPAVRPGACAAFGTAGDVGEKLVVVAEISREHRAEADAVSVAGSVRAAVVAEHELSLGDLVLAMPGQVARTSSGKIMRAAARTRYLAGEFVRWPVSKQEAE